MFGYPRLASSGWPRKDNLRAGGSDISAQFLERSLGPQRLVNQPLHIEHFGFLVHRGSTWNVVLAFINEQGRRLIALKAPSILPAGRVCSQVRGAELASGIEPHKTSEFEEGAAVVLRVVVRIRPSGIASGSEVAFSSRARHTSPLRYRYAYVGTLPAICSLRRTSFLSATAPLPNLPHHTEPAFSAMAPMMIDGWRIWARFPLQENVECL